MKKILLLIFGAVLLIGCKKDSVDASSRKAFQSSINDMASSLNTLQQVKFNEALYILKTFGVEGTNDVDEIKNLGKLLEGKKVPEILAMADRVALKNGITWTSTGPPSLGEMNIFGNEKASEFDANDVKAAALSIITEPASADSILGPKVLMVKPRLVDSRGNAVDFSGAALETVMEASNNGVRLLTSKNLMQSNDFKGFALRMASLPADKVSDGKIDITVTVKTTARTFKLTKVGVPLNMKVLVAQQAKKDAEAEAQRQAQENSDENSAAGTTENPENPSAAKPAADPKNTVYSFLNNLSSQNFRGAYSQADNPGWGSYDAFANPTSGFGGVKNITVKNVSTKATGAASSTVNATYDVTDRDGRTTALNVTFSLKNVDGNWKITNYKIN